MEAESERPAVIAALMRVNRMMIDSAIAFEVAAREARNFSYYAILEHRAIERKLIATHFQQLIRSLGHRPPLRGSLMALVRRMVGLIVHRLFADEAIIIALFNRAEEKSIKAFEQLLGHPHISAATKAVVEREYKGVCDGYMEFQKLEAELMNHRPSREW